MAISILIIALVAYAMGLLDSCSLLSRFVFGEEAAGADYFTLYRRHKWQGVGYAVLADMLRALVTVLVGGMLLKRFGFPSVGKLLALLFALLGQAMPLLPPERHMASRQELVYPALTLLLVDWKLFPVCVALAVIILALTGSRPLMAAAAAVALPVFTLVFGGWWLKVVLALGCGAALIYCYWEELRGLSLRKGGKKRPAGNGGTDGEDGGRS
ncbi:MAG: hypothetical protein IKP17_01570 [Oscillospiraceae bacterium]|nr:hypothetical protein [Oscillospiraceae bacterium]